MMPTDKTARRKKALYRNQKMVSLGFFVSFCAIYGAYLLGIASYSFQPVFIWCSWVILSELLSIGLIARAKYITYKFALNLNLCIFGNWILLWLWSLSFLGEVKIVALFGAMLALIFLLSYSGFLFSILLSIITTAGFMASTWLSKGITEEHFNQELYYGSFYFVTALFLSWAAGQFEQQRNTIKKALKESKESLKIKQEFLGTLSHEIRTPLNMVIGSSELLQKTPLSAEQQELAEDAVYSAGLLRELINNILDYSKLESGKMEVEQTTFGLQISLQSINKRYQSWFAEKGLDFELELGTSVPLWTRGDWNKLQQVLVNLLNNAHKFASSGTVTLRVFSETTGFVRFEVQDQGIGISPAAQLKIFSSYTQADASTTRLHGGTGLGLSISQQLVHLLGGHIAVNSRLGIGSCFSFVLPFDSCPAPAAGAPAKSNENFKGVHFLVAEDNRMNQKLISKLITKQQGTFEIAENGVKALHFLSEQTFDLVLMDLQMPEMDGITATQVIRKDPSMSAQAQIPIIALTANVLNQEKEACLQAGMNDFVTKPISMDQLITTVLKVLKTHELVHR